MSRLTRPHQWGTGLRRRAGAGRDAMGFGVPAFAHPLVAPTEWAELARPGAPLHWAAFDVARGPGTRPDPLYGEVVGRVRENGVPVLGLLDCRNGTRPFGDLLADASHYLDWYRVDGFYLDRAPTGRADAAECRRVVTTLRALLHADDEDPGGTEVTGGTEGNEGSGDSGDSRGRWGSGASGASGSAGVAASRLPESGGGQIVLGHGEHPWPGYAELADQLVTFCGPWTSYRWSEAPEWTAAYPPERFVHLVHGLPRSHLDTALRIARWQGASTVCLTDRTDRDGADPWAGLAGYWHEVVRMLRKQPSPST
ncbi:spherulation-specific family 4 protein [Streptomyces sp. NPDC093221]|uniref:spherulation-specific family 4 protein n=1 Tax=Streptomyces sp. NPDC093221 TaxID=3366032 RepID=UPI00380E7F48